MFVDYVMDGRGYGEIGQGLADVQFDPGMLRPYFDENGKKCVTLNTGEKKRDPETGEYYSIYEQRLQSDLKANGIDSPVFNATTLRKDEWIELDRVVIRAARQRLRAWSDLAAVSRLRLNGMSKTILEHESISDPGQALVDMDALSEGHSDHPHLQLEAVPLPITHSSFHVSSRKLAVSRNSGTPIDTVMGETSGRRVAEAVEQTLSGAVTGLTYGATPSGGLASTVFGYTNYTNRNTKTDMTAPTGSNGTTVLTEWLALRELLFTDRFYGPYMAYTSDNYDQSLDDEFKTNSDRSLRERLRMIDGITDIRRLDFLTTDDVVVLVQMTPDVARAVIGMPITTVQWETKGGMQLNFKTMAIMVPQLRGDFNDRCGIAHGTTS